MKSSIVPVLLAINLAAGASTAKGEQIEYATQQAGRVSLGIYDADGRLLRMLQSGRKLAAGEHAIDWDGRDDTGRPLPPGTYAFRGLAANVGWEFQLMMGNAGRPPYPTADGKGGWGGVHGHVLDAAVDETGKRVYLLWTQEEGSPALLKVDPHGGAGSFIVWGAHNGWSWGRCQAVATDGEFVYVANNQTADSPAEKGAKITRSIVWRAKADSGDYANTYPGANQGLLAVSEIPGEAINLFGIAADDARLYCTLRAENKLVIFNKQDGSRLKDVPIAEPGGLVIAPDGSILVISGRHVVRLSPEGQTLGVAIADDLDAPYDLCVGPDGKLYVSDRGASMQVKVFRSDGKLLRRIGRAGGRAAAGKWAKIRRDLLLPTGPAVTADGTLYVGEDVAPKRVAIFRKDKLADEWIGPLASGCSRIDIADHADPQYVYQTSFPDEALMRYRVNYAKKSHVLDAVWTADPAERNPKPSTPAICRLGRGSAGYVRHYKGRTFFYTIGSVFRVDDYELVPAARVTIGVDDELFAASERWPGRPQFPKGTDKRLIPITLHDANGDGLAEDAEADWSMPPGYKLEWPGRWSIYPYVDDDLNVYARGWKVPFLGLDAKGNPIYSWSKAEKLPSRPMGKLADPKIAPWLNTAASIVGLDDDDGDIFPARPMGREINMWIDPDDGSYYYSVDMEGKGKGIGWASSGIFARIGRMTKAGTWRWLAGTKAMGFAKPGQFYKPGFFAGIVGDCLFITDWNGQMRIYDKNTGLYAGSLFSDGYRGPKLDENLISVELTEADVFTHPKTGDVYALAGDGPAGSPAEPAMSAPSTRSTAAGRGKLPSRSLPSACATSSSGCGLRIGRRAGWPAASPCGTPATILPPPSRPATPSRCSSR